MNGINRCDSSVEMNEIHLYFFAHVIQIKSVFNLEYSIIMKWEVCNGKLSNRKFILNWMPEK